MNAQMPRIAVGLHHLRLAGEVLFFVLHVPLTDSGWKLDAN